MFVLIYYNGSMETVARVKEKIRRRLNCAEIVATDMWAIAEKLIGCDGGPNVLWIEGRDPGGNIPGGVTVFRNGRKQ